MYMSMFLVKMLKVILIFAIFAIVMLIKNMSTKKCYGKIALAVILPALVEFMSLFDIYFSFNEIAFMAYHMVMWLLMCFVYVLSFLMIYKSTTNGTDGMVTIFRRDFKRWNIAVIVATVLGAFSLVGQTWYIVEYGDEYAQRINDAINNSNFLSLMTVDMGFGAVYDRLVDLNNALYWVIIACMIIPAVMHSEVGNVANDNGEV